MDDTSKLIERIRKLLSRTPGAGATQAEAETALSLARKLMDQHGLDAETVASHAGNAEDWATEPAWESPHLARSPDAPFIGPILTEFFHVMAFEGRSQAGSSVQIFGEKHRVEVAKWVFVYLAGMFNDLWLAHRVATKCRKDRRRAFYMGLARGIVGRLRREKRDEVTAVDAGDGKALALIEDRVRKAFDEAYPGMPKARRSTFSDYSTVGAGIKAGQDINIARPVAKVGPRGIGGPTS